MRINLKKYLANNYGSVILATLGIMSIPLMLYVFNSNEFADDPFLLLIPVVIAITVLIFGGLLNAIGKRIFKNYFKFNHLFQAFLSSFGLLVFLNDIIVPTQATALNGEIKFIPESVSLSIFEFFIGLVIYTFLMVNFNSNKVKKLLASVAAYSISLILLLGLFVLYFSFTVNGKPSSIESNMEVQNKQSPNVYFLWLDAMQSDYFIKAITDDQLTGNFNNFTLYKNNISNYLYTLQSYQSFRSSTIFDGLDYKKWGLDDRMRDEFKKHNYSLTSYGMPQYVSELDNHQFRIEDAVNETLALKHPYFSDFNSLSLVRMTPNFLANESLLVGQIVSDKIISYFYPNIKEDINTIDKGMYPNSGPITYKHLSIDEKSRQDRGEFVLAQIIMPHGPYVMSENCDYITPSRTGNPKKAAQEYYRQVRCATKLLTGFIDTLKKLDRYDDSIIVVMGDHGSGWTGLLENDKIRNLSKINARYNGWNEPQLLKRASSLLMIKPAGKGDNAELIISRKETQLLDIVPTLFGLLNWETDYKFEGRNTFSDDESKRNSIMTYFKPTTYPNFDDAEIYHINYDEKKGRTKLSLINEFNEYFNLKKTKIQNSIIQPKINQQDSIRKLDFDK